MSHVIIIIIKPYGHSIKNYIIFNMKWVWIKVRKVINE